MTLEELFSLRDRTPKPRNAGLTHVLDKGLSVSGAEAMLESGSGYVDIVKFGWATAVVIENLEAKLALFRKRGIEVCCGGSLFELSVQRGKVDEYVAFLKDHDFHLVEISDGVIDIEHDDKLRYIERLAKDFRVLSEVGSKDAKVVVAPYRWVNQIKTELGAGAWKVVLEARESGTVGLYRETGEIRHGLIEEIEVQIDARNLIWEAPQKAQQVWLVKHFGCNVNLGNIPPEEVISLETIRQGLRADTMLPEP
jgi:phosphosulfolactate synthase